MSSDLSHIKMCPQCRGEYQAHMQRCIECDVALGPWAPAPPRDVLPPIEQLVKASSGGPFELEQRAQYLSLAGIPSCIDTDPPGQALAGSTALLGGADDRELAIYVAPALLHEATQLLHKFDSSRTPDAADELLEAGAELEACPACGTEAIPDAEECHDCGLMFG